MVLSKKSSRYRFSTFNVIGATHLKIEHNILVVVVSSSFDRQHRLDGRTVAHACLVCGRSEILHSVAKRT